MTEAEWKDFDFDRFECRDEVPFDEETWQTTWRPQELRHIIEHHTWPRSAVILNERKLRLCAVACCYRVRRHFYSNDWELIEACERFADGSGSYEALKAQADWNAQSQSKHPGGQASYDAIGFGLSDSDRWWWGYCTSMERVMSGCIAMAVERGVRFEDNPTEFQREFAAQADLLREVLGNPFRPVVFCPEWRTDTALTLAQQMYESRDFSAMPILADAIQDAGCDCDDILNHCRQPGVHVRGCWLVDLILAKS